MSITKLIYLDNKIHGAMDQLVKYFEDKIFDINTVKVIFKVYPKSYFYYKKTLEKHNIKYISFKKYSEIDLSNYNVVFYLFNAQSNCRIVANRNAKHIFLTHGESNKISSIKPIIRIYDHIICSGQVSLDRYIQSNLFTINDIKNKRLLMMGNTFIGQVNFTRSLNTDNCWLLYAPTWEGGLENENYTSISKNLSSFLHIKNFADTYNIKKIIIQPHPNTGHRNKKYLQYLQRGIDLLTKENYLVGLYKFEKKMNFFYKLKNKLNKNLLILDEKVNYKIYRAFVDISAMEVQLINNEIPTNVFIKNTKNAIPNKTKILNYYKKVALIESYTNYDYEELNIQNIKPYYIDYTEKDVVNLSYKERIKWLEDYVFDKSI